MQRQETNFLSLPTELIEEILLWLPAKELFCMFSVNKRIYGFKKTRSFSGILENYFFVREYYQNDLSALSLENKKEISNLCSLDRSQTELSSQLEALLKKLFFHRNMVLKPSKFFAEILQIHLLVNFLKQSKEGNNQLKHIKENLSASADSLYPTTLEQWPYRDDREGRNLEVLKVNQMPNDKAINKTLFAILLQEEIEELENLNDAHFFLICAYSADKNIISRLAAKNKPLPPRINLSCFRTLGGCTKQHLWLPSSFSALAITVHFNNGLIAKQLLDSKNFSTQDSNENEKSVILEAIKNNEFYILELLIKAGYSLHQEYVGKTALDRQNKNYFPLIFASFCRNAPMMRFLLDHGADIAIEDKETHETALHVAASKLHVEGIELILSSFEEKDSAETLKAYLNKERNNQHSEEEFRHETAFFIFLNEYFNLLEDGSTVFWGEALGTKEEAKKTLALQLVSVIDKFLEKGAMVDEKIISVVEKIMLALDKQRKELAEKENEENEEEEDNRQTIKNYQKLQKELSSFLEKQKKPEEKNIPSSPRENKDASIINIVEEGKNKTTASSFPKKEIEEDISYQTKFLSPRPKRNLFLSGMGAVTFSAISGGGIYIAATQASALLFIAGIITGGMAGVAAALCMIFLLYFSYQHWAHQGQRHTIPEKSSFSA